MCSFSKFSVTEKSSQTSNVQAFVNGNLAPLEFSTVSDMKLYWNIVSTVSPLIHSNAVNTLAISLVPVPGNPLYLNAMLVQRITCQPNWFEQNCSVFNRTFDFPTEITEPTMSSMDTASTQPTQPSVTSNQQLVNDTVTDSVGSSVNWFISKVSIIILVVGIVGVIATAAVLTGICFCRRRTGNFRFWQADTKAIQVEMQNLEPWSIKYNDLSFLQPLGEGRFGHMWKVS